MEAAVKVHANNYKNYWWIIGLLPVFWAVGADQFFVPILVLLLFIKRLLIKGFVFKKDVTMTAFGLWLFFIVVSTLMIDESYRYVTWIRNFSTSLSGVCMAYLVCESHTDIQKIKTLLFVITGYAIACSLAGFVGVLGVDVSFMSPVGRVLGVGNYSYLYDIFYKTIVQSEALWFAEGFVRPRGLLLYSNLLSGVVLVGAVAKLYALTGGAKLRPMWKLVLILFLFSDGVVVVSSLSRSAWIGLAASMLTLVVFVRIGAAARFSVVILVIVGAMLSAAFDVEGIVTKRFVEKGHSNQERMLNYVMIKDSVLSAPENFLFGFGTQRDVSEMDIPLGSHSTYLGILFKYGFIGLFCYVAGLVTLLERLRRSVKKDKQNRMLGAIIMVCLVQLAVQGLFIEIDVDAIYMMIWWTIVGLALAYISYMSKQGQQARLAV